MDASQTKVEHMFDMRSRRMDSVKERLEMEMQKTEQNMANLHIMMAKVDLGRKKDTARLEDVLADVNKKLRMLEPVGAKLSKGETPVHNTKKDEGSKTWQPTHMIIGGTGGDIDRETIERECDLLMRQIANIGNDCQRGYAPQEVRRHRKDSDREGTTRLCRARQEAVDRAARRPRQQQESPGHVRAEPRARATGAEGAWRGGEGTQGHAHGL